MIYDGLTKICDINKTGDAIGLQLFTEIIVSRGPWELVLIIYFHLTRDEIYINIFSSRLNQDDSM